MLLKNDLRSIGIITIRYIHARSTPQVEHNNTLTYLRMDAG